MSHAIYSPPSQPTVQQKFKGTDITIIALGSGVVGLTILKQIQQNQRPTMRPLVGGWVLILLLLFVSMIDEQWALIFAWIAFVTAFLTNGASVISLFNKAAGVPDSHLAATHSAALSTLQAKA